MSTKEEENAAELKIGEEFLKAKCLMNCEVALILELKYEQLQQTSNDPMNQVSQHKLRPFGILMILYETATLSTYLIQIEEQ
ncbi:hypothetical protein QQ045_005305 [Rhodiola kirilowii]